MPPRLNMHTNRKRADSFGNQARAYDMHRPRYPEQLIADLVALGAHRVLDVGAGTGIASQQLAERGGEVLALEPDSRMAAVARGKGIPAESATFEDWDPAGRMFDLVVFASSFHWVDPAVALPKVRAMLCEGGHLVLMWNRMTPTSPTHEDFAAIYRDYMDVESLPGDGNLDEIAAAVAAAGYAVTQRRYAKGLHYSAQQWLDLAFTHSNHLTLPAAEAGELRRRLADRIGRDGVAVHGEAVAVIAAPV